MFLTKHTTKLLEAMHLASTRVEEKKTTLQISCSSPKSMMQKKVSKKCDWVWLSFV